MTDHGNVLLSMGGTLDQELIRTAELLVELSREQGVYFAVALLHDSGYDLKRLGALLPILQETKGARK